MFKIPQQFVKDFQCTAPGTTPLSEAFAEMRKGPTFLAVCLQKVPTRLEHMRSTESGYNVCEFVIIKAIARGFAGAPYKNIDPGQRGDAAKVQQIMKYNRDGKPLSESLQPDPEHPDWPRCMRIYPYKKDGVYDKGERQEALAAEICASNVFACYINSETFQSADAARPDAWKLPFDSEEPIEAYTLCEIEIMPKNSIEAQKGKGCRISRVRRHRLTLNTYAQFLADSTFPADYKHSVLVQLMTRVRSPSVRSDVNIARTAFFVRAVNPEAVVYNIQENTSGLVHIVNWDTDHAEAAGADLSSLVRVSADETSVDAFIHANATRYNKDKAELDPSDPVDFRFEDCTPARMPIDVPTAHARRLLNCSTTEDLIHLLQLAIHLGALRVLVIRDPYWSSAHVGGSCFRGIPLVDTQALLQPISRHLAAAAAPEVRVAATVTDGTTVSASTKHVERGGDAYAIKLISQECDAVGAVLCYTHEACNPCLPDLDRVVFSVCPQYIKTKAGGAYAIAHVAPADRTLDMPLQCICAAPAEYDRLRVSAASQSSDRNITYADHAYVVDVVVQPEAPERHRAYLRLLYTPGGGAAGVDCTAIGAAFDPASAECVQATLGIMRAGTPDTVALRGACPTRAGARPDLMALYNMHKAAARQPGEFAHPNPYTTAVVRHTSPDAESGPDNEDAADADADEPRAPTIVKRARRA